jgi:hypothetical protein
MPELFITEQNCVELCGAGHDLFNFGGHVRMLNANQHPMGSVMMFSQPMTEADLIPEEEWPDLIAQKDRERSWLDDMVEDLGIPCKDQNGLGYCHGYGPVTALEVMRAVGGFPYVDLSAESIAGRVTNWTNNGGDPEEDLSMLAKYGACPASFMDKPNSIRPKQWKAGWEEAALEYKAEEFVSGIQDKMWQFAGTCALRNICTSPWYNWWGHCISGSYRLRNVKGEIWRKDRNNWGMSYGDRGYLWLKRGTNKGGGTPSGIVAVRVPTPLWNAG